MRRALRPAALALTALALLATSVSREPSCPADAPIVPAPVTLEVDTTCGMGSVAATVEPATCTLTLEGADALGLPAIGRVYDRNFRLSEGDRLCECNEIEPGVYDVRCSDLRDGNAVGCGGGERPSCSGTIRLQAQAGP